MLGKSFESMVFPIGWVSGRISRKLLDQSHDCCLGNTCEYYGSCVDACFDFAEDTNQHGQSVARMLFLECTVSGAPATANPALVMYAPSLHPMSVYHQKLQQTPQDSCIGYPTMNLPRLCSTKPSCQPEHRFLGTNLPITLCEDKPKSICSTSGVCTATCKQANFPQKDATPSYSCCP